MRGRRCKVKDTEAKRYPRPFNQAHKKKSPPPFRVSGQLNLRIRLESNVTIHDRNNSI